jgi:hypothetical protein
MLLGFFDESGDHPYGTSLECLTIGGCIATPKEWQCFSVAWDDFRARHRLDHFHCKELPDDILEAAARVLVQHVKHLFGVSIHIPPQHRTDPSKRRAGKRTMQAFYEYSAIEIIWHAGRHAGALGEDIALVFAKHPDFSLNRLVGHFDEFKAADPRLHSVEVGHPQKMVQLQAADLIAYEASRFHRDPQASVGQDQLRGPMRALREGGASWALEWGSMPPLLSRKFFLSHPLPLSDNGR